MALTAKGEARREVLLSAVIRLLEREGPSGITHRSVAAEAGLPVAAATYYFTDIDDLLISALTRATAEQSALFAHVRASDTGRLAELLHTWIYDRRGDAIAQYELLLLAMRRDSLRDAANRWYETLEHALAAAGLDEATVASASLALDGLMLRMLWRGEPATVADLESTLRGILQPARSAGPT